MFFQIKLIRSVNGRKVDWTWLLPTLADSFNEVGGEA